jgi:hypothetical protein
MKKTFKQFDIEKKSWDLYLESKGYKKIKKKKDCGCQHEDYSQHFSQRSFLDYLSEATNFHQSWKQQGEKIHRRAQEIEQPGEHLESPDSLRDHFQNKLLTDLNPDHHAWVLTRYRTGGINRLEDVPSRVIPSIKKFNELKEKGEAGQVKLSHFPTLGKLEDYVEARSAGKQTSAERFSGADHHVEEENEHWKVIIPKNHQAACKFGSGTRWCTSSLEDNYFDHYNSKGPLRIMIPKNPAYKGEKYQWHAGTNQLMNEKDDSVDFKNIMHGHRPWEYHDPDNKERSLPKISAAFAYARDAIGGKDYPIDTSIDASLKSRQLQTLEHLDVHPDVKKYAFKHKLNRHEHLLTDVHFDEMAHSGTEQSYDYLRDKDKLTPHRRAAFLHNSDDLSHSTIGDIIHHGDEKLPEHSITEYLTKLTRKKKEKESGQEITSPENRVSAMGIPHLITGSSLTDHHISQMVENNLIEGGDLFNAMVTRGELNEKHKEFGNQKDLERIKTIDKVVPATLNKPNWYFKNNFYREANTQKSNISHVTDAISPETLHKDYHRHFSISSSLDFRSLRGLMGIVASKHLDHITNASIKDVESTPADEVTQRFHKGHYDHPILRSITDDYTNRIVHSVRSPDEKTDPSKLIQDSASISYGLSKQNVSDIVHAAADSHNIFTKKYQSTKTDNEADDFSLKTFRSGSSENIVNNLLKFGSSNKLTPEHGKRLMGMLEDRALMLGHDAKLDGDKAHFIDPTGHANNMLTSNSIRDFHKQSNEIMRVTGLGKDEKYLSSLLDHPSTLMQSMAGNAAGNIRKKYLFTLPDTREKYNDVSPELRQKILTHKNPIVRLNYLKSRVGDELTTFGQGGHIGHPEGQHEILDLAHAAMSDPNPMIRDKFFTGARQVAKNIMHRTPKIGQKFNPKDHATPEVLDKAKGLLDKVNTHGDTIMGHLRTAGLDVPDNNVHKDIIEMENFINKQ